MLKNNFLKLTAIVGSYFIVPFSICMSAFMIVTSLLNLHSILQNSLLCIGIILGLSGLIILFLKTNSENALKREILKISPYLFIVSLIYIYISTTSFLQIGFQLYVRQSSIVSAIIFGLFSFLGNSHRKYDLNSTDASAMAPLRHKKEVLWITVGILFITVIGIYFRIEGLNHLSFWVDEANTVIVSERIAHGFGQTLLSGEPYLRGYLYHHYIAFLLKIYDYPNLVGRLANIPFYIATVWGIYKLGEYIKEKRVGLLSALLFSLSWFGISMARDLRFYEMFLCLFLFFSYLSIKVIIEYFNLEIEKRSVINIIKNKSIMTKGMLLLILGLISIDTQVETVLILYPIILFGIILSIFHKKKEGFILSLVAFLMLVAATIYNSSEIFFDLSYLLIPPAPDWKVGFGNLGFFDFFNYLLMNGYWYIPIIIIALFLLTVLKREIKLTFLFCMLFCLYFATAIQGYGIIAIRYYYFWFPFLLIGISYCTINFCDFLFKKRNMTLTLLGIIIYLVIITSSIITGIQESRSAYLYNSRNEPRNINYREILSVFNDLKSNLQKKSFQKILSVTDDELGMPFYENSGTLPDLIFTSNTNSTSLKNKYLNVIYIYFENLSLLKRPTLVILFKRKKYFLAGNYETINPQILAYFNQNGKKLYDDGSVLIYSTNQ